jgi:uncharacterized RDD family membrane protein YckC
MIIQIVCSDSSNPYTSQCMCGRPVVQWSAIALYTVVFLKSLDVVVICVIFSLGRKKKKTQRSKFGE